MKYVMILIFGLTSVGCFLHLKGQQIDHLNTVCVRYVDDEGYLRGRTSLFNDRGLGKVLAIYHYSEPGACVPEAQGPTTRVTVCLVASSKCYHDRTTNIWGDQIEQYFERYPGSYRGKCTSECSLHEDDCLKTGQDWAGITDWQQWRRWMRNMGRGRQ